MTTHNNNQNKGMTIWDGVKIGCGIFIVLPAIIIVGIFLILCVPTCAAIKDQREKGKQRIEQKEQKP